MQVVGLEHLLEIAVDDKIEVYRKENGYELIHEKNNVVYVASYVTPQRKDICQ